MLALALFFLPWLTGRGAGLGVPCAWAQEEGDEDALARYGAGYVYRQQAAAADALVEQLGPAAADIETLFELSRLLSAPCDQVRWLHQQLGKRSFAAGAETQAAAQRVSERVARLQQAEAAALGDCGDVVADLNARLLEIARPEPLYAIADPAVLSERWRKADAAEKAGLSEDHKLMLLARGVPGEQLALDTRRPWDAPRQVVSALAAAAPLRPTWELLQLDGRLRGGVDEPGAGGDLVFPVEATFQIARGLLDRALGVDGVDRGDPAGGPDWAAVAGRLEQDQYWAWASLAWMLQAASQPPGPAGSAGPADATTRAEALWQHASQVGTALGAPFWPALGHGPQSWLARLKAPEIIDPAGQLPLRHDYRQGQRERRAAFEQAFLAARQDPAEAFRLIQSAKAADVGLDAPGFRPVELADLVRLFKERIRGREALRVYALLEMIEVRQNGARQLYAVRLNAQNWDWLSSDYDEPAVVGPFNTPAELARSALGRASDNRDLRILIAPDGPLDAAWFAYEQAELLPRVSDERQGWLYYLPSAAALERPEWTPDLLLRYLYRTGLRTAAMSDAPAIGWFPENRSPATIGVRPGNWPARNGLYAVSIGPLPPEIGRLRPGPQFIAQFKRAKEAAQQAPLPVMLVLTGPE